MFSVLLVVVATVVGAPAATPVTTPAARPTSPATTGPVRGRLPSDVVPLRQDLSLDLDPARIETRGTTSIAVTLSQPRQQLWLNARQLVVDQAVVVSGGERLTARFAIVDEVEGVARLELPKVIAAGPATIELRFRGALHDNLDSLYRVDVAGRWYLFSQFEALGAREAFPCFDEPANKIPFRISVTHPRDITVVGNTQVVKRSDKNGRTTIALAETKPLPTYLLAFVGGPIEIVDGPTSPPGSLRMTPLPLRGIVTTGHRAQLALSLKHSADVVADQERAFGIAYPFDKFDIVAVPDFSSGAMENAGLITYRDTRLYVDERSPLNVQKASLEVIAHETAHQWFGNLVTMRWWDDLWLNEAFATWMAARTLQRLRPDFDGDLEIIDGAHVAMDIDSLATTRRIREPIVSRGDIDNAFDDLTYSKGAAVIAMVERFVDRTRGDGTFLRGVASYLRAHAYGTGGSAAFFAAISAVAGIDVTPMFTSLIDQPGVPAMQASCSVVDGAAGLDV
ncbi:MAG TPA: M1 family metallopeptidase, partial [Myxococcota bacterium]